MKLTAFWLMAWTGLFLGIAIRPSAALPSDDLFNRQWIAYSTTSISITGDVSFSPTEIIFDNKVKFEIRHVSDAVLTHPIFNDLKERTYSLYEIVTPEYVEILNGNGLCGSRRYSSPQSIGLARYLAVTIVPGPKRDMLHMAFYSTPYAPDLTGNDGLCGTHSYFYEKIIP